MRFKGITLIETVVSLAIVAIIALSTATAFSSAGSIFRRSVDIQTSSEHSSQKISEMFFSEEAPSEKCLLKINENIILVGKLINCGSDYENGGFSGYLVVKPEERRNNIHNETETDETGIPNETGISETDISETGVTEQDLPDNEEFPESDLPDNEEFPESDLPDNEEFPESDLPDNEEFPESDLPDNEEFPESDLPDNEEFPESDLSDEEFIEQDISE